MMGSKMLKCFVELQGPADFLWVLYYEQHFSHYTVIGSIINIKTLISAALNIFGLKTESAFKTHHA